MELLQQIVPYLAWIIAIVLSYLIFKYLKYKIEEKKLQPVILYILNLILGVEGEIGAGNGELKRNKVTRKFTESIDEVLETTGNKGRFERFFGTASNAVQWVFDKHNKIVNNPVTRLLFRR